MIENLQNEGRTYEIAELILYKGACRRLVPGWSKALVTLLEENSLNEISNAIRPSKFTLLQISSIVIIYYL